jgi:hypothetical protein
LREETILANWNDDFTYKWFKHKEGTKDGKQIIVGDGTHPNRLAYEKFYVPIIEEKLKTLSL